MKFKVNTQDIEYINKYGMRISKLSYKDNLLILSNQYLFNLSDKSIKEFSSYGYFILSRDYNTFFNTSYFVFFDFDEGNIDNKSYLDIVDLERLNVYKVFIEYISDRFDSPIVCMFQIKEGLLIDFYSGDLNKTIILDLESKTIIREISLKFDYLICVHPNEDILLGWEKIFKSEQYKLKYYSLSEDIQGYLEFPYKSFSSNGSFSNSGKYLAIEIPESAVKLDYLDKIKQEYYPILRMYDFDSKTFLYEIELYLTTYQVFNRGYEVYDIFFSKNDKYLILVIHDGQFGDFIVWVISTKDGKLLATTSIVLSAKYDVESDVLAYVLDSDGERDTIIIEPIEEVIKNNPRHEYLKNFYMTGFKEWYR